MNIKLLAYLTIPAFLSTVGNAQELTSKIPANAQFVVSINNKAIVEHTSMELLNETLVKLGAFEQSVNEEITDRPENLLAAGFDLDRQAYIYKTSTDSLYYIGILLPLKASQQVSQHMFANYQELPETNGYQRRVSSDGKTQAAWNQESLLVLTGDVQSDFFDNAEVAERYNIVIADATDSAWVDDYSDSDSFAMADTTESTWIETEFDADQVIAQVDSAIDAEATAEVTEIQTSDTRYNEEDFIDIEGQNEENYEDFQNDDEESSLWNTAPENFDYQNREMQNDSIKNVLFTTWLSRDFINYLEPTENLAKNKAIRLADNKHLLRVWVSNLDQLYSDALPYDIVKIAYGVDMKNLKYGYRSATLDLIQDRNIIKMQGTVNLDKETAQLFNGIYSNKMNKKFKKYIPENHLAYASVNISTEGYLKQLPGVISRWYAPLLGENGEFLKLAATAIEIGLDEKAIGNIKRGDDVFFLNDLQKVQKEYTAYEYDENYEYQEVTKMKDEYVPSFLWMFTSRDQRLFKKILDLGVNKQEVTLNAGGVYTIEKPNNMDPIYIYFKKDMVFVGSDIEQISSIQENRFKSSRNSKVKKEIFANQLNMIVHTAEIPEVVRQLEIPVTSSWEGTLQDLSLYGDLQLKSNMQGKGNVSGEISLELPTTDKNALQYLLKHLIENLDGSDEN